MFAFQKDLLCNSFKQTHEVSLVYMKGDFIFPKVVVIKMYVGKFLLWRNRNESD